MDIEQLIQRNTFGHLFMNSKVIGLISQQFCQTATPQGLGNHSSVHRCSKQSTMISTTGIFVRGRNHPKISPFSMNLWKTRPNLWKTQVWWLRSPSNSTQPKDRSIVGVVFNRWLPICLNLFSFDHLYYPKRCIRSDMASSLPSNWSYTWSQHTNFSILLDSKSHLAKTLCYSKNNWKT